MSTHSQIRHLRGSSLLLACALLVLSGSASAQTTAFTYQGKLNDNGNPASGPYDFEFKLFDTAAVGTGTQQGSTLTRSNVQVAAGIFTVQLDFGAAVFPGADRYLEISVRPAGGGAFTVLAPRQAVTSTPYAVQSLNATNAVNAATATNATQLGGLAASQYVITSDSRLSDARNPLPNSANYIQNTTTQQPLTNFNISGNGLIGGNLGIGTNNLASAKLQVSTTALDQHLYLSPAAPSLALGNSDARSSATMNALFALSTAPGHFGVGAGSLTIANYGNARGNIYIDSNYSGNGATDVILQPFAGQVGIGTTTPASAYKLHVETSFGTAVYGNSSDGYGVYGNNSGDGYGVVGSGGVGVYGYSNTAVGIGVFGSSPNYAGYFEGKVHALGFVSIDTLGSGGSTSLCRNASNQISTCSSSLRYKTAIRPFIGGLDLIKRLRPITFTWKEGGMRDLGFGAEEVEKVEPLLTFRNNIGEIEGVKYDRITLALVNAAREQQTQIERQRQQINQQQAQMEVQQRQIKEQRQQVGALKKLVCADHPNAEVCKSN